MRLSSATRLYIGAHPESVSRPDEGRNRRERARGETRAGLEPTSRVVDTRQDITRHHEFGMRPSGSCGPSLLNALKNHS